MSEHYISRFSVEDLWGYENYDLILHDGVNVIIGPNASGKTTIINILYNSLSGNLSRLFQTAFTKVTIDLSPFTGNDEKRLLMVRSDEEFLVNFDNQEYRIPLAPSAQLRDEFGHAESPIKGLISSRRRLQRQFQRRIRELVPAVWLPVSRRLPIAEEEDIERRRVYRRPLESVDECLSGLVNSLQKYRQSLNADLSDLRREFQRHALENILYDKQHDSKLSSHASFVPPSKDDEESLAKAFRDVGLMNQKMEVRIKDHFAAAREAYSNLGSKGPDIGLLFMIPLINRTRSIVGFAQELENERTDLFSSLHAFETIVNSFINDKDIKVSDQGDLIIRPDRPDTEPIDWRHLSSGEKQILILLTQALLSERNPVVYVADEPELSLHVSWQEKLLGALSLLAGRCQFIVATHSPDIVAEFGDRVIDLDHWRA